MASPLAWSGAAAILRSLRRELPWLEMPDSYAENTDALDSLIASQTARAAAQSLTHRPPRPARKPTSLATKGGSPADYLSDLQIS
jgi:hypothetical protein